MATSDYTTWITAKTRIDVGGVLSIDSDVPADIASEATEWIRTESAAENKE